MPAPEQPHFRHEPLDTGAESIRLLRLLPGPSDSVIECELFNATYPLTEEYAPLSYEWAEPNPVQIIHVNGFAFLTQPNLHAFLWQIRSQLSAELPLLLWVDAICIDQNDVKERNHQVQMMKRVFSEGRETLMWLGPEADDSGRLMEELNVMFSTHKRHADSDSVSESVGPPQPCVYPTSCVAKFRHDAAARALCKRSYWRRVWILQEIVLSHRHRVFVGASKLLAGGLMDLHWLNMVTSTDGVTSMGFALHVWIDYRTATSSSTRFGVWRLLEMMRSRFECTTAHDRVYGLLGFASDDHDFRVDCNTPFPQLCLDLMIRFRGFLRFEECMRWLMSTARESLLASVNEGRAVRFAWADYLHLLWSHEHWNHIRDDARCPIAEFFHDDLKRVKDIQEDITQGQTTFSSGNSAGWTGCKTWRPDSTNVLHDGLWHWSFNESSNLSLFFSGSPESLKLELVALAMHEDDKFQDMSEQSLAAFRRHAHIFDKFAVASSSASESLLSPTARGRSEMHLDLCVSILAAELSCKRVVKSYRGSEQVASLKQIWPNHGERLESKRTNSEQAVYTKLLGMLPPPLPSRRRSQRLLDKCAITPDPPEEAGARYYLRERPAPRRRKRKRRAL